MFILQKFRMNTNMKPWMILTAKHCLLSREKGGHCCNSMAIDTGKRTGPSTVYVGYAQQRSPVPLSYTWTMKMRFWWSRNSTTIPHRLMQWQSTMKKTLLVRFFLLFYKLVPTSLQVMLSGQRFRANSGDGKVFLVRANRTLLKHKSVRVLYLPGNNNYLIAIWPYGIEIVTLL